MMEKNQREIELEVEVFRLKQRLALVSKFALAAEQDLIILASSSPADECAPEAEPPEPPDA